MPFLTRVMSNFFNNFIVGSNSDGGIWANSDLGKCMEARTVDIPNPEVLKGTCNRLRFTLVGDEAFPLKQYLMRSYPKSQLNGESGKMRRIFNYRLSRARRVIENTFGILCSRWRILSRRLC